MPVRKVKGGYKVEGTKSKPMSKAAAERQLKAIKASQNRRNKK